MRSEPCLLRRRSKSDTTPGLDNDRGAVQPDRPTFGGSSGQSWMLVERSRTPDSAQRNRPLELQLSRPKVSIHSQLLALAAYRSLEFRVFSAGVPPISSTVVNASSQAPMVTMRILDENSRDAVVTHLGQKLTLRIQLDPPNDAYDITAGHLVASSASGDASYLLLDELGCPTDPTTFPALTKDPLDGRSLISTFAAFKFPDSQLVRFNVIVRFCLEKCTPTICKGDQISYGRRKRAGEPREETLEELPLQLSIIVQNPVASSPDRLSSTRPSASPDTVLITGENSVDGLFCVDPSLALSLLIFWLIIQIALIVGCLLTVAQYRRTAIRAEEERANVLARHLYGIHGGNFEIARRVRWADHRASSSSFD